MTVPPMRGAELAEAHKGRFRVVGYSELRAKTTAVAAQILERYGSERHGVVIAPVLMGGAMPARLIMDAMLGHEIVAEVAPCRIRRYEGVGQAGEAEITMPLLPSQVKGRVVIGVDDLVDGGQTLAAFRAHALAQGASQVDTAVIFAKPHSTEVPGFCAEDGITEWLIMPGEELDFMDQVAQADVEVSKLSEEEQAVYFRTLGFDEDCVRGWTSVRPHNNAGVQ
jgi:hypoxanthine-guanine phosphoribosyltransferase